MGQFIRPGVVFPGDVVGSMRQRHVLIEEGIQVSLSHPYLQAFVVCYGRHSLNTTNYYAS